MADFVARAVSRQITRVKEMRLRAGPTWQEHGLLFPNAVGKWLSPTNIYNRLYFPLLERAGLPRIRFHDLRHSCATLLLAQRVDIKTVSTILGHASISITADTYTHAVPHLQSEAMDRLGDLLAGE